MNEKTKALGLLVLMLLAGIVVGVILAPVLFRQKVGRFDGPRKPLKEMMLQRIDASEEQRIALDPILSTYESLALSMRKRHVEEMRQLRRAMKKEVEPFLTQEQRDTQEERRSRHEKRLKRERCLER